MDGLYTIYVKLDEYASKKVFIFMFFSVQYNKRYKRELQMSSVKRVLDVPGINLLWRYENLFLGGAPSAITLEVLAKEGVKQVINMRSVGESDISGDQEFCENNEIDYHHIPVMGIAGLDKDSVEKINNIVNDQEPCLIHCASGNRVAGWLITYLVAKKGMEFEQAVEIAQEAGLRTIDFIYQAQDILDS